MKKTAQLQLLLLFFLFTGTASLYGQSHVQFNGFARNYLGVFTREGGRLSIVQNTFDMEISGRMESVSFTVNPYINHQFDRSLEPGLREAYLDLYFSNFDFRIGRQQVIYGKAEGVFITDVVSPKDMREFLLPDFNEIRMGITAAKLNYYRGASTFEAVWVPVFTPAREPDHQSPWSPEISFPYPVPVNMDFSEKMPETTLENSELFFRYSRLGRSMDIEMVAAHFLDENPSMHIQPHISSHGGMPDSLTATPKHHRLTMGGGSFSLPVSNVIVRGEAAFYNGKQFQTMNPNINSALIEKQYLHYMAGMDINIWDWNVSMQFIQEYILDHQDEMIQDKMENMATLMVRNTFLREKLDVELFAYAGINYEDALIRPSVGYQYADGFHILAGANIFLGDEGRFGQFNNNDMVYTKIKYSF